MEYCVGVRYNPIPYAPETGTLNSIVLCVYTFIKGTPAAFGRNVG